MPFVRHGRRNVALILRRTFRFVSKDEGVFSARWILLRDAAYRGSSG